MSKKVFLGVGHGGSDPGAVYGNWRESDLNLAIALACRDELVRHGVSVLMSREKDENDSVSAEVRECNAYNPDLAIDIHLNAGKGDGFEVFYESKGGTSKVLASNIENEVLKIGQNSRGLKIRMNSVGKDYYLFVRDTESPSVIVECAFIDNPKDFEIVDTLAEQKVFGRTIAKGILKTLGISYREDIPEAQYWYSSAQDFCMERGISDGTRPNDTVTRAEVWSMIHRLYKTIEE